MEIFGHRGWPTAQHPENTLASFRAALMVGVDGVEADVRLSRDDVAVCCHDDDLQRVSGAARQVGRLTLDELRAVRLPGGHTIPTVAEAAALAAAHGARLVLDLKPGHQPVQLVEATLAGLAATSLPAPNVVLSSFDSRVLDVAAVLAPHLERAAILDAHQSVLAALAAAQDRGDGALHLPLALALAHHAQVLEAVGAGIAVRVWTVNRVVDVRLLQLLGVGGVVTDLPAELHAARRQTAAV